jgi:acetyl esterase/lipase
MPFVSRPARLAAALLLVTSPLAAQSASAPRPMTPADISAWKSIRSTQLSHDGRWFAYVLAPNEGDAEVILREVVANGREHRFSVGDVGQNPSLTLSGDGKWAAFVRWPLTAEAERMRRDRRAIQGTAVIVDLTRGTSRAIDKVRSLAFAGDAPRWIALQGYSADAGAGGGAGGGGAAAPVGAPTPGTGRGGPLIGGGGGSDRALGTDLVLHELGSETMLNIGNVNEYAFDHTGRWLAYTIDATNRLGNGVQLRDMNAGTVRGIDAAQRASYRRLAWADTMLAFTVLRTTVDSSGKDTVHTVMGVSRVGTPQERRIAIAPSGRTDWPAGTRVSLERAPRWSHDLEGLFFGVAPVPPAVPRDSQLTDDDRPSLRLWHDKDQRLQSQQDVQATQDRTFSYLAAYWPTTDKVVQLTDAEARTGSTTDLDRWVISNDVTPYQRQASVDGINKRDVYVVNPRTGEKRKALTGQEGAAVPSIDGQRLAFWRDGEWHVLEMATLASRQVTTGGRFINVEDDHNVDRPSYPHFGWAQDGSAFLASDGWDVWRVPVSGGAAVNLTQDGKAKGIRYGRPMMLEPRQRGINLAAPFLVTARVERTKREGILRVDPRAGRVTALDWKDARMVPMKARNADVWVASISTAARYPDYWRVTWGGDSLRLTDGAPNMNGVAWTPGARLVTYVSDKGDTLQGALYLPAGYEEGKRYPTVTYIYEKMSDNLHTFYAPSFSSSYTPSIYTSRGYAVFQPDITYKINDPGMSAVWSVIPAIKAAVATGIVDEGKVGLHGHSWGGYQTAFLVGQTNIFKSAVAGAPLTDMVSMYSSVYWNTGSANQPIFQSSQGRFKGNFIDNRDAYERNSPNRYANKVETPLIILHNDRDGAVDYNQGITFYNTLRQLDKDVILLEYQGENHGLSQLKNRRDYTIRLMEWWDTHLKGERAPEWIERGIPRLEMERHFRERKGLYAPAKKDEPAKPRIVP